MKDEFEGMTDNEILDEIITRGVHETRMLYPGEFTLAKEPVWGPSRFETDESRRGAIERFKRKMEELPD